MVTSSARSFHLAPFAALLAVLACAASGHATCDPTTDPDNSDIANARAAIAANCPCTGAAVTHGTYVSCAPQQAKSVLTNKSCAGFVKRCASHATCGKPGAVTCCLTTTKGTTCKIKKDAAHCTARQGTVGNCTSCCDACAPTGCTTTTTTTFGPRCPVDCSGLSCPPGEAGAYLRSQCGCALAPACGGSGGVCGGNCPAGTEGCHYDTFNGCCLCGGP